MFLSGRNTGSGRESAKDSTVKQTSPRDEFKQEGADDRGKHGAKNGQRLNPDQHAFHDQSLEIVFYDRHRYRLDRTAADCLNGATGNQVINALGQNTGQAAKDV